MIHQFDFDPNGAPKVDYVVPSQRQISMTGNYARRLLDNELDMGCLRPYVDDNGQSWITRNYFNPYTNQFEQRAVPTMNDTNATLRFLDWIELDNAVVRAVLPQLRVAQDLINAGLTYRLPNGIAKTILQHQQMSDTTGATISMDALRRGESDRPVFSTITTPIPIIHKDFQYPLREVLASRTGYSPLDTETAALAARKVGEQVEQLVLGSTNPLFLGQPTFAWNGMNIYGMMNWPGRITYSLTQPTAGGWTPDTTVADILNMKKASQLANHLGPWVLYFGLNWDPYMDADYKPTYNATTLRQRLRLIDGIQDARTAAYMNGMDILMLEMNTGVMRIVIGMDVVTIQWESEGGLLLNFKIMCCMLPQLRADIYGNTGLVHAA